MSIDRRRSPRIELLGRLHGHVVSLDVPVIVREISLGGMAVETTFSFPVGVVHEFRLTLGDGAHVLLRGQARHSRSQSARGRTTVYTTGFEFVDEEVGEGSARVGDLIDRIG